MFRSESCKQSHEVNWNFTNYHLCKYFQLRYRVFYAVLYVAMLKLLCRDKVLDIGLSTLVHRPFSYSGKESESNDVMMQFEEFSNVHNSDRTSNSTRSNLAYKTV